MRSIIEIVCLIYYDNCYYNILKDDFFRLVFSFKCQASNSFFEPLSIYKINNDFQINKPLSLLRLIFRY